jgi:hypothetical protein
VRNFATDKRVPALLLANGVTQKFIAQRYNTTAAHLHHWLKKRGIEKPKTVALALSNPGRFSSLCLI